jgi:hypothetical protein
MLTESTRGADYELVIRLQGNLRAARRKSRSPATHFPKELSMNRTFNLVALQSVAAAAIIAVAPAAFADNVSETAVPQTFVSTVDRATVQRDAIDARDAQLRTPVSVETHLDPTAMAFTPALTRAQVHAEAVEAARLGVTGSYDGKTRATPEQLAQITRAGQRASSLTLAVAR